MEIFTSFKKAEEVYTRLILNSWVASEVAVFNVDGVLRDKQWRESLFLMSPGNKNFKAFYDGANKSDPIPEGVAALMNAWQNGYKIVIVSGYPEERLFEICRWLEKNNLLHFISEVWVKNAHHSSISNQDFKLACYKEIQKASNIKLCFDDNVKVGQAVKEAGLTFRVNTIKDKA